MKKRVGKRRRITLNEDTAEFFNLVAGLIPAYGYIALWVIAGLFTGMIYNHFAKNTIKIE